MSFLSSLAAGVKAAAVQVKDASVAAYNNSVARPSVLLCSGCDLELAVPPTAFDWKCTLGHANGGEDTKCKVCAQAQTAEQRPTPSVRCPSCSAVTSVPGTNAEKAVIEAGRAAKKQYEVMKSRPSEFHCHHCNSKLVVPSGAWVCQTCSVSNPEGSNACLACSQPFDDQKVVCGVCGQSTKVPSMRLLDDIMKASRDISMSATKAYYDLSGKSYVTCPRCTTTIEVPRVDAKAPAPDAKAPAPDVKAEAKVDAQAPMGGGASVPGGAPSAPAPAPAARAEPAGGLLHVTCSSCRMQLSYVPPAAPPPAPAPSSSPAAAAAPSAPAPASAPASSPR